MQAMLITAWCDAAGLERMLIALGKYALCFVHADAKGEISEADVRRLNTLSNVMAIRRYRVNWGSIRHLQALIDLVHMALSDNRVTQLHLISAQDFPTVSAAKFLSFFEGDDRIHMQRLRIADYPELAHRYQHFHFMHLINYKDNDERIQNWIGRLDRWQEMLHIRRRLEVSYKGLVWLSMPREAAEYAVNAPRNKRLLRQLRYTYIPEEFYFQNAFSETRWESRITGNALRFSIWNQPERGMPALLNIGDLPTIDASGALFCRKVRQDSDLFGQLEQRWLGEDQPRE